MMLVELKMMLVEMEQNLKREILKVQNVPNSLSIRNLSLKIIIWNKETCTRIVTAELLVNLKTNYLSVEECIDK